VSRPLPFVVAWGVFATYLVAARIVGNFFPFSVFDMYRERPRDVAARVLAIDASGAAVELDAFEGFVCEEPLSLARLDLTCGADHRPLDYVARDQELYVEAHRGTEGGEPIAIVSRAYALSSDHADSDCVIARCTARRRGAPP
jgi:hypothetical protein